MVHESIVDPNKEIAKGYPAERDAGQLRRNDLGQRTRTAGRIPGRKHPRRQSRRLEVQGRLSPAAGRPLRSFPDDAATPPRPPRDLAAALRAGDRRRPRRAGADRPHRRRRAPHRLRPRLPGLAQVLRRHGAAARHPRGDRVRQPAADRVRRLRRDRRQRARLLPRALPLAPGAVRRPAAARRDRPGDPRRPRRQVPPRAGPGDVPLHPLDDAARRLLRARLVLALRALGAAALQRPPRRLGGAGADPARAADDPRRHDRHRLRAPRRRPRRPARPPLHLRGRRDAGMGGRAPRGDRHHLRLRRDRASGSCCAAQEATGGP